MFQNHMERIIRVKSVVLSVGYQTFHSIMLIIDNVGGMICTDDENIYQVLKMLRGHGLLRESDSKELQEHNIKILQN